jgi:hypothetical protein
VLGLLLHFFSLFFIHGFCYKTVML